MQTFWYMGSKTRLLPGFIRSAVDHLTPRGGTVLDLFAGTGAVAMDLASRYTILANDVQRYSSTLLGAVVGHGPRSGPRLVKLLDFEADLRPAYERHRAALTAALGPALEQEAAFLEGCEQGRWQGYRDFLLRAPRYPLEPGAELSPCWRAAAELFRRPAIDRKRQRPSEGLHHLAVSYYQSIYFGLNQCVVIDSLRAAIDGLRGVYARRKRRHYLAALLCAASVSTSGTSHFAQPRGLSRAADARAIARRRRGDILADFLSASERLTGYIQSTRFQPNNKVYSGDYRRILPRLRGVDTVYADPPYTSDNYSRFYHVLEVLARYDYPELARRSCGGIAKGRYPVRAYRFQSDFCSRLRVEDEFRCLVDACAGVGAKLALSYAAPTGLLFRRILREAASERRAERRFLSLFRERYRRVSLRKRALMHSGQGDSNRQVIELLVLCQAPREAAGCAI